MIENINLKEKLQPVQMITYLLGLTMIFMFACGEKYFTVWNYYLFPLVAILIGAYNVMWDIWTNKKMIKMDISDYCMIFIIFYVLFSSLVLRLPANFDSVISYGFLFLLLLVSSLTKFSKKQIIFILKCYIASAVIITIIMLIQRATPYPGVLRFSIFYSKEGFYDVNFLATYIAVPPLLSLNNAMLRKDKDGKIKYYTVTAIILLGVFLTGSRGALVGFIIGALFIICINRKITLNKIKQIREIKKPKLKTVVLIIAVIVLLYLLLPKELTERFFAQSYNDGSNQKRLHHWMYSIQSFIKQPIFGTGITWTSIVIEKNFGVNYTSHNTFLGVLMQLGVVGSIPFMIVLINPIKQLWKANQRSLIGIILGLVFMIIMIEAQSSLLLFIHLSVIYIIMRYSVEEKIKIIL